MVRQQGYRRCCPHGDQGQEARPSSSYRLERQRKRKADGIGYDLSDAVNDQAFRGNIDTYARRAKKAESLGQDL